MTSLRELSHDGAVRECLLAQLTPPAPQPPRRSHVPRHARSTRDSDSSFLLGCAPIEAEAREGRVLFHHLQGVSAASIGPSESRVTRAAGSY